MAEHDGVPFVAAREQRIGLGRREGHELVVGCGELRIALHLLAALGALPLFFRGQLIRPRVDRLHAGRLADEEAHRNREREQQLLRFAYASPEQQIDRCLLAVELRHAVVMVAMQVKPLKREHAPRGKTLRDVELEAKKMCRPADARAHTRELGADELRDLVGGHQVQLEIDRGIAQHLVEMLLTRRLRLGLRRRRGGAAQTRTGNTRQQPTHPG